MLKGWKYNFNRSVSYESRQIFRLVFARHFTIIVTPEYLKWFTSSTILLLFSYNTEFLQKFSEHLQKRISLFTINPIITGSFSITENIQVKPYIYCIRSKLIVPSHHACFISNEFKSNLYLSNKSKNKLMGVLKILIPPNLTM